MMWKQLNDTLNKKPRQVVDEPIINGENMAGSEFAKISIVFCYTSFVHKQYKHLPIAFYNIYI